MKQVMRGALCVLLMLAGGRASGQYFSNGQDPFSTRWMELRTERYRLIYPDRNEIDARRVAAVLDTAYTALHYGFSRAAMRLPILLHTQNLHSNGMVVWTPRRTELIIAPPTETFATPWLKQLTVHEYRHVVQMSNLNRGVIRAAAWLLGEQALGASAALVPRWFLEGDAVLAETALAAHGRALQPEFTLAYRALLAEAGTGQFSVDKWFIGSYREPLPNHYHYGYQMVNYGYKRFGPRMWDDLFDFIARRPYLILPRQIAMRRFYGTSSGKLFREAFGELKTMWDALPPVAETMRIVPTPIESHTTYSHPLWVGGTIVAHKTDLSRPERLVAVDPLTGAERVLARTGPLSSRPVEANGELFWTEYRPDAFWEQKNRSIVRRMAADGRNRPRTVRVPGNLFYVTPYGEGFAAVAYDPAEKYAVVLYDGDFQELRRFPVPDELSVHGMAWDNETNTLGIITLSEQGMALTAVEPQGRETFRPLTAPSFVSINHLRAGGGKFFYHSIRSGRDESHGFDLSARQEFQLSASSFGSTMPAPDTAGETLVQATYRRQGYLLSTQPLSEIAQESPSWLHTPPNSLSVSPAELGGPPNPNLDALTLYPAADARPRPARRYRRAAHLLQWHSWAPISFDPLEAANSRNLDLQAGGTVMTQNELSSTEGFLSYGRVGGGNWWRGGVRLLSMAPKFELNAEYGGGNRSVVRPDEEVPLPNGWDKAYFSVGGRIYLPVNLSWGGTLRSFTPSLALTHYNTMTWRPDSARFEPGFQQSELSLAYAQNARMAVRDLAPRWGFGMQASWAAAPFDAAFGTLWSFLGNAYLPGVAANHSLRLRGAYQTQRSASYHFSSNVLFPRGVPYNFTPKELLSTAANYRFPVAYPDGGIDGLLYIRRLSADLFGGYARYRPVGRPGWRTAWSYGVELSVDFTPLRMAGVGFTFKAALYTCSEEPVNATAGFAFNL